MDSLQQLLHRVEILEKENRELTAIVQQKSNRIEELEKLLQISHQPTKPHPNTRVELAVHPSGLYQDDRETIFDCCVVFAENGREIAENLRELLQAKINRVTSLDCTKEMVNTNEAEKIIAKSRTCVLLITANAFRVPSLLFAMECAVQYSRRIIAVHDCQGCPFPSPAEQPEILIKADVFYEKALSYLKTYANSTVNEIIKKLSKQVGKTEDIRTKAFLSHKRSSAQGMAGRIYQGLKDSYTIFLDTEAQFDLHDLQEIVRNTEVFFFILTEGVFDSFWCCQELMAAVEAKKKIVIIRDVYFRFPTEVPPHAQALLPIINGSLTVEYMAEFYSSFVQKLKEILGPSNQFLQDLKSHSNESLANLLQDPAAITEPVDMTGFINAPLQEVLVNLQHHYAFPFSKIRSFKINCSFSDESAKHLLDLCPNLEELMLCSNYTGEIYKIISQSACALKLKIMTGGLIDDTAILHLCKPESSLIRLDIGCNISNFTDVGLKIIADNCSHLKVLNLEDAYSCTAEAYRYLAQKCKLEKVSFKTSNLNDTALQFIAEGCGSTLQSLNLDFENGITGEGFKYIGKHCSNLRKLKVSSSDTIEDEAFSYLAEGCSNNNSNLIILHLYGLNITDKAMGYISKAFPNLKVLQIMMCKEITDDGMRFLCESKLQLKTLRIGAARITDNSLKTLARSSLCTTLKNLSLPSCARITAKGIANVSKIKNVTADVDDEYLSENDEDAEDDQAEDNITAPEENQEEDDSEEESNDDSSDSWG